MIAVLMHILALVAMPFIVFERLTPTYKWYFRMAAVAFVVIVLGLIMASGIAVGYPENVRHGYPSCAACHVAGASGGGAVTAYGRSAGAEVMPTWSRPGEDGLFGFVELPEWVVYGGNSRYINVNGSRHAKFWMQREVQAGFALGPLTVLGTAGSYGPLETVEYRTSYAKLRLGDHVALRAGRFIAAYGVTLADHRLPTRSGLGLGQGQETYNGELTFATRYGEVTLTSVNGQAATVDLSAARGYDLTPKGRRGAIMRAALFAGDKAQVGVSAMRATDITAYGAHAIVGGPSWYALAEWDRRFPELTDVGVIYGGYEPVRGVHVGPSLSWTADVLTRRLTPGLFTTWFPRPHLELGGRVEYGVLDSYESLLMFHYYL